MLFHVLPIDPTCGINTLACAHKATQNASGAGDVEDVVVMPSPQEDGSDQCLATSETRINQFEQMARGCQVFKSACATNQ